MPSLTVSFRAECAGDTGMRTGCLLFVQGRWTVPAGVLTGPAPGVLAVSWRFSHARHGLVGGRDAAAYHGRLGAGVRQEPRSCRLLPGLAAGRRARTWQGRGCRIYDADMGRDPAGARLVVGLLGPVEIGPAGGVMASVAQSRLRVLLGLLGIVAGRVVSAEALVDGVWGEEWSPGREQNLHALVYQLRRRLAALEPEGGARLVRAGAGYRL